MSAIYKSMADNIAREYNIPGDIFAGVITQESGWNPSELGKAGEIGLGQLTPRMYKSLGVNPWIPKDNLTGSAKFLSQLYNQYGNWRDALSHYNAGFNLSNGRGYADKILGKIGYTADNVTQTPVLDVIKSGGDPTKVPGISSLPGGDKSVSSSSVIKDDKPSEAKEFFSKFGLWVLAGFLIIIGVWRVIK